MSYYEPAPSLSHRTRLTILVAAVVGGIALIGLTVSPGDSRPDNPGPPLSGVEADNPTTEDRSQHLNRIPLDRPAPAVSGGEADGAIPDRVTVLDNEIPGIANLDPALLVALRRAATDASDDGVAFFVYSGWRSPQYQHQLLLEAIARYGSVEEAARWVASPERSAHVSGDAVDIGPSDAMMWLTENGSRYGLCQVYRNEPWHYELRPDASHHGCPPMYADPTQDPRMQ